MSLKSSVVHKVRLLFPKAVLALLQYAFLGHLSLNLLFQLLFICLECLLGFPLPGCCLKASLCHHIQPPDNEVQQPGVQLCWEVP